jgi:hypothetical protein
MSMALRGAWGGLAISVWAFLLGGQQELDLGWVKI